jgi:hypothetical protein
MKLSFQSHEGHTTLTDLSDAEVDAKFAELTRTGHRGFATVAGDEPTGPIKSVDEARRLNADEVFMIAPLQGG